jgi:glycosyltransferase involved in cell wall biosynthesis
MKSLFIANEYVWPENGIGKKIHAQVRELNALTGNCKLVRLKSEAGQCVRLVGDKVIDRFGPAEKCYMKAAFYWYELLHYIAVEEVEFLYIRYTHFANWAFIDFLKQCKRMDVQIVLEIPTYPYDCEHVNWFSVSGIKRAMEMLYRKKMHKYVDFISTFSEDQEIFGVPCINISNAVDPRYLPVAPNPGLTDGVHFIAVANLGHWHGYDRMIRSLGDYYRNPLHHRRVEFHLVGTGPGLEEYRALAKEEGVENSVHFHGAKSGPELDAIFAKAHIGVDSLGRHRSGNTTNNSLKSKEYLMRGLPLIKSHIDPSLVVGEGKVYRQVDASDNNFNLNDIVQWYIHTAPDRNALHAYAMAHFTWRRQMQIVVTKLLRYNAERKVA